MYSDSQIRRTDKGGMLSAYQRWPSLAREGFSAKVAPPEHRPDRAYIMGMGGSAAAGDILAGWFSERNELEVSVLKGRVPFVEMKGSIALACSVSGDTEETLQMMKAVVEKGATTIAISGNGRIKATAGALGIPHIQVPPALAQRLMLPFLVYSALAVLNTACKLGCDSEVEESIGSLESEWKEASLSSPEPANQAKALASSLVGKTPAIYADRVAFGVGIRFKNVINENSKRHAHFDAVPEAFHNEIESWEDPGTDFLPVFIRHSAETKRDAEKLDHMVGLLDAKGKAPVQVRGRGRSLLSQLMSMTYRLDMTSYYLALPRCSVQARGRSWHSS